MLETFTLIKMAQTEQPEISCLLKHITRNIVLTLISFTIISITIMICILIINNGNERQHKLVEKLNSNKFGKHMTLRTTNSSLTTSANKSTEPSINKDLVCKEINSSYDQQDGTRLWKENIKEYINPNLKKTLDITVPFKSRKLAFIRNKIWVIAEEHSKDKSSVQEIQIYETSGKFVKSMHVSDWILLDIIQAKNNELFVIATGELYKGLYILNDECVPNVKIMSSVKGSGRFKSMYVYGNHLFVLKSEKRIFQTFYSIAMFVCTSREKRWIKKKEFKFGGQLLPFNDIFIVQNINNPTMCQTCVHNINNSAFDSQNLQFFFSSHTEIFIFNGDGKLIKKLSHILNYLDTINNVCGIDKQNNLFVAKHTWYFILNIDEGSWQMTLDLQMSKKYDVILDNDRGALWLLSSTGIDTFGMFQKSRILRYENVNIK